jgi:hypothetical protein
MTYEDAEKAKEKAKYDKKMAKLEQNRKDEMGEESSENS